MTLTMTMIGMAIGQIFGGPVSDKMGRRAPLFLGMAGFTLASLVCSLADDIYVFLIFRFVQGLSGAFGIVVSRAVARDTASGPELMRFLSVLMMVNGIAPVAAPVLGGQILLFSSWQGIFQILVLVGIIQIICTFNFKETLPPEKRSPDFRSGFFAFSMLLKDKYFFGHCLVQCFVFGSFFSYIAGSSFLFQNIYGVSAQVYSYIFGAVGLGLMVTGALPARLAGTIREVVILRFSLFESFAGSLFFLGRSSFGRPSLVRCCLPFCNGHTAFSYGSGFCIPGAFPLREKCGKRVSPDRFLLHGTGWCDDAGCRYRGGPYGSPHGSHHGVGLCILHPLLL